LFLRPRRDSARRAHRAAVTAWIAGGVPAVGAILLWTAAPARPAGRHPFRGG